MLFQNRRPFFRRLKERLEELAELSKSQEQT